MPMCWYSLRRPQASLARLTEGDVAGPASVASGEPEVGLHPENLYCFSVSIRLRDLLAWFLKPLAPVRETSNHL